MPRCQPSTGGDGTSRTIPWQLGFRPRLPIPCCPVSCHLRATPRRLVASFLSFGTWWFRHFWPSTASGPSESTLPSSETLQSMAPSKPCGYSTTDTSAGYGIKRRDVDQSNRPPWFRREKIPGGAGVSDLIEHEDYTHTGSRAKNLTQLTAPGSQNVAAPVPGKTT